MRRFCLGLLCLLPIPALADGKSIDGKSIDSWAHDCGGDAYTFAEVVPAQPGARRREPIMVLPDTLCADLAGSPGARIDSLTVVVEPRGLADERSRSDGPTRSRR